jgi:hypothetical protein
MIGEPSQVVVKSKVILALAKASLHIDMPAGVSAHKVKRKRVFGARQLQVELGKLIMKSASLPVCDDSGRVRCRVIRNSHGIGPAAVGPDKQTIGAARVHERGNGGREKLTPFKVFQGWTKGAALSGYWAACGSAE